MVSLCSTAVGKNNLIVTEYFQEMDDVAKKYLLLENGIKHSIGGKEETFSCFSLFKVHFDENEFIRENERTGFGLLCKHSPAGTS
jgi:hypothetical protein